MYSKNVRAVLDVYADDGAGAVCAKRLHSLLSKGITHASDIPSSVWLALLDLDCCTCLNYFYY